MGRAGAGLFSEKWAQEQIRKLAEEAFVQAFKALQIDFADLLNKG